MEQSSDPSVASIRNELEYKLALNIANMVLDRLYRVGSIEDITATELPQIKKAVAQLNTVEPKPSQQEIDAAEATILALFPPFEWDWDAKHETNPYTMLHIINELTQRFRIPAEYSTKVLKAYQDLMKNDKFWEFVQYQAWKWAWMSLERDFMESKLLDSPELIDFRVQFNRRYQRIAQAYTTFYYFLMKESFPSDKLHFNDIEAWMGNITSARTLVISAQTRKLELLLHKAMRPDSDSEDLRPLAISSVCFNKRTEKYVFRDPNAIRFELERKVQAKLESKLESKDAQNEDEKKELRFTFEPRPDQLDQVCARKDHLPPFMVQHDGNCWFRAGMHILLLIMDELNLFDPCKYIKDISLVDLKDDQDRGLVYAYYVLDFMHANRGKISFLGPSTPIPIKGGKIPMWRMREKIAQMFYERDTCGGYTASAVRRFLVSFTIKMAQLKDPRCDIDLRTQVTDFKLRLSHRDEDFDLQFVLDTHIKKLDDGFSVPNSPSHLMIELNRENAENIVFRINRSIVLFDHKTRQPVKYIPIAININSDCHTYNYLKYTDWYYCESEFEPIELENDILSADHLIGKFDNCSKHNHLGTDDISLAASLILLKRVPDSESSSTQLEPAIDRSDQTPIVGKGGFPSPKGFTKRFWMILVMTIAVIIVIVVIMVVIKPIVWSKEPVDFNASKQV